MPASVSRFRSSRGDRGCWRQHRRGGFSRVSFRPRLPVRALRSCCQLAVNGIFPSVYWPKNGQPASIRESLSLSPPSQNPPAAPSSSRSDSSASKGARSNHAPVAATLAERRVDPLGREAVVACVDRRRGDGSDLLRCDFLNRAPTGVDVVERDRAADHETSRRREEGDGERDAVGALTEHVAAGEVPDAVVGERFV